nr:hypothetical protein [Clostridia bacterium]
MNSFKRITIGLLAASFVVLTGCDGGESIPFYGSGDKWTAGFGCVEIIKDKDALLRNLSAYYVAGYNQNNPAQGILDNPTVRAVWLDDNSGRGGVILCAVDCVGISSADINDMRARLDDFTKDTGCRAIHIMSTHTHAAPDTLGLWGPLAVNGKNPDYMQAVSDSIYEAVHTAYDTRRDGKLYYGSAVMPDIQFDSRDPQVFSRRLDQFRFEDESGHSVRIFRFDIHPEALGGDNSLISADFPHYMAKNIKEATGDDTVFFAGAVGGLIYPYRQRNPDGSEMDNISSTYAVGKKFADAALSITDEDELEPALNIATAKFDLTLENTTFALMTSLGVINYDAKKGDGPLGLAMTTSVTYCTIGGIACAFVPGELFPELAYGGYYVESELNPTPLSDIAGVDRLLIFGLCDDEIGYIVPESDFLLNEKAPYLEKAYDEKGRR